MTTPTAQLSANGVSIWLDDLSRSRIVSGGLKDLIASRNIVGVTTNPTIFANALAKGDGYQDQVAQLAAEGVGATDAIFEITTKDVADACDIFADIYHSSKGFDGRVSIEVEPKLANETAATIAQAKELFAKVNRENVMIKIPATKPGLAAITAVIAEGISVNVTLIFSLARYREVIAAYIAGIAQAKANGHDISKIHSVASFFVSRVDTEVDNRLVAAGHAELRSKAALANARLAYEVFEQEFATAEWSELAALGANVQRPLMASTGVKDAALPDTLYVTELVAPQLVNTMPEKTLEALFDHGVVPAASITNNYEGARADLAAVAAAGVSLDDATQVLETEGVDKFIVSWNELVESVETALKAAK
ncbi:transaldolase [Rhodoluna sp.]|uniref:transaldolase n=1 Tax=Rhodoluna sp. TaxID=1969481 RepID=UPI0025F7D382|nr:transaldolase [Rhodoluna sp.]